MAHSFQLQVSRDDWHAATASWNVPILLVPGATVEGMYVDGSRIDPDWYRAGEPDGQSIHWVRGGEPPSAPTFTISLKEPLTRKSTADVFKLLTVVLPLVFGTVGSVVTKLLEGPPIPPPASSPLAVVHGRVEVEGYPVVPHDTQLTVSPPQLRLDPDGRFELSDVPLRQGADGRSTSLVVTLSGYETATVHLQEEPKYGAHNYHVRRTGSSVSIEDAIVLRRSAPYGSAPADGG